MPTAAGRAVLWALFSACHLVILVYMDIPAINYLGLWEFFMLNVYHGICSGRTRGVNCAEGEGELQHFHQTSQLILWGTLEWRWPCTLVLNWARGTNPYTQDQPDIGYSHCIRKVHNFGWCSILWLKVIPGKECSFEPSVVNTPSYWAKCFNPEGRSVWCSSVYN